MKKKPKTLKDIYPKTRGAGGKSPIETMKPKAKKKMNALDAAIMKQKPLKSKNKNPGRYLDK
jgi:hypothetical protein